MAQCWHCGVDQEPSSTAYRISFRAVCEKCDHYLHCCKNCNNYKVGMPNDCLIPGTDPISDRESFNFCEEFSLKGKGPEKKKSIADASSTLFGDENPPSPKRSLDSLFD